MYEPDRQVVGVVLTMEGAQETDVAAHHLGSPHAAVGIRIGDTLMYVHERETAERLAHMWSRQAADAARLPARLPPWLVRKGHRGREVTGVVGATVVMDARGAPPVAARLVRTEGRPAHLRVQVGRVVFYIRDQAAYASVRAAFSKASDLAASVMPEQPDARSRREKAFERANGALPPVMGGRRGSRLRPRPPAASVARQPSTLGQEPIR